MPLELSGCLIVFRQHFINIGHGAHQSLGFGESLHRLVKSLGAIENFRQFVTGGILHVLMPWTGRDQVPQPPFSVFDFVFTAIQECQEVARLVIHGIQFQTRFHGLARLGELMIAFKENHQGHSGVNGTGVHGGSPLESRSRLFQMAVILVLMPHLQLKIEIGWI